MANRYWVGGTGNWSDSTNHWSTTSGGSPAALQVPTSSDDVFIDSNSGFGSGGTITLDVGIIDQPECHDLICSSGHTFTISPVDYNFVDIYGSLSLESGITVTDVDFLMKAVIPETITTAGIILTNVSFKGVGGSWTLQDNLTLTGEFYMENGTFDANDHNVTANDFYFYADTGNTPTVIMGSGVWEGTGISEAWYVDQYSGEYVTVTPETSTIKLSNASVEKKMFVNYDDTGIETGKTYHNLWFTGSGTGRFAIYGANTFNNIIVDNPPHLILFQETLTTTVSSFTVSGESGSLVLIDSVNISNEAGGEVLGNSLNAAGTGYAADEIVTVVGGNSNATLYIDAVDGSGAVLSYHNNTGGTGYSIATGASTTGGSGSGFKINITNVGIVSQHTLSKSSGVVICDYLNISNSNATGGALWYAGSHSLDTTNNDGWIFGDPRRVSAATNFQDPGMI